MNCLFCKNTLLFDKDWKVFGKVAELPPEITPLQVGTNGTFLNEVLTIIGRRRMRWTDGYWTEWYASFSKGKGAWIAEAQGLWMIAYPVETEMSRGEFEALTVASSVKAAGKQFAVNDIKIAKCLGSEGELPVISSPNEELKSIDASNTNGDFLSLESGQDEHGKSRVSAYVGRYVAFGDFHFKNLRHLDGW
ncbi:MAG: DUF4178 domain-containing protein [Chitinophagaceae bacterium]|nr:DUF4178 domain-containing protein [Oligoflexus sp.]